MIFRFWNFVKVINGNEKKEEKKTRKFITNKNSTKLKLKKKSCSFAFLLFSWCYKVASWNPYGSHYFIYTDAGAWRSRRIVHWPDARFVKRVARLTGDRMLLGQINPKNRELGKDSIQGTFFAGTCRALADFKRVFYSLHDKLMDAGAFVGKDQEIMNALAYGEDDVHRLEQSVVVLQSFRASCANKWFFYQRFFASDDQYRWMRCPQHDRLSLLELHEVYSAYPLPEDVGYASIEDFLLFAAN